jgi:hypothetical protein
VARVKVSDARSRSRSHRVDPADTDLVRVVAVVVVGDYDDGSTYSDRRQKRGADFDFDVDDDTDADPAADHVQRPTDRDADDTPDNLDLVADENEGGCGADDLSPWRWHRRRRHTQKDQEEKRPGRNDPPDSAEKQVEVEVELDFEVAIAVAVEVDVVVDNLAPEVSVEHDPVLPIARVIVIAIATAIADDDADDNLDLDLDQGYGYGYYRLDFDFDGGIQDFRNGSTPW